MNKPVNWIEYNFEHEKGITPEREQSNEKNIENGAATEDQISATRQRNALADIQTKSMLNSIYNLETEDEAQKNHFDIHFFGEYSEDRKSTFKIRQEYDLQIVCSYTKTEFPTQKIGMYVYPSLETKKQSDPQHHPGKSTFLDNEFRIYRVWADGADAISEPHEITKAVLHAVNNSPLSFFQEGLAIAVGDLAFGYKLQIEDERKWVDEYITELLSKQSALPSIGTLLDNKVFDASQTHVVIPIAGSFTKYLIQTFTITKFKVFYSSCTSKMNLQEVEEKLAQNFGSNLAQLESQWIENIRNLT